MTANVRSYIKEKSQAMLKDKVIPHFGPGDTLRVHLSVQEDGGASRTQIFEGDCLGRRNSHNITGSSFIVRKITPAGPICQTILLHSPVLNKIEVVRKGRVRRAKPTYLTYRTGKSARIKAARVKTTTTKSIAAKG